MDVTIKYEDVFSQCQDLSSYEGREAVSPSGESDYLKVHLTDQDKPLIKKYTDQAVDELRKNLGRLISAVSYTKDNAISLQASVAGTDTPVSESGLGSNTGIKLTIDPLDESRVAVGTLSNMMAEVVHSWVMMSWCSNHLPTREEFYKALFVEMVDGVKRMVFRKKSPILSAD